ncbi:MAG: hypothetical protein V4636_13380, partial [Pseudomonadota bacterium]
AMTASAAIARATVAGKFSILGNNEIPFTLALWLQTYSFSRGLIVRAGVMEHDFHIRSREGCCIS